ncbi:unnamed protein product [Heligmosomoides polygyrus]|uniref:Uncharacterized protein n=1 Tax=Heligmosomoides polygyrus TaxID=6339 RepID=A0A183FMN0_HELPZ|nr:unnamed protein product [Heligmosomoides polygyrus]
MADNGEAGQTTTHPCCNHVHHYTPVTEDYCLLESPEENTCCLTTDYPYAEAYRRLYQAPEDPSQRRITLWRHRIAAMPAPLAQFDKETNIMSIVHTSV